MSEQSKRVYEFGDYRIETANRRLLRRDGAITALTPRVFDTLLFLVEHSGSLLEKEQLMAAIWPDQIVEENNLSQNISTLRRALGERPGLPRYILTVPGRGYRFLAQVTTHPNDVKFSRAAASGEIDDPSISGARTIAVLPFQPLVPEQENPALELGMADTLITKLSNSRGMIVRSLSSVRKYATPEQDPLTAGEQLGVQSVLEGTIQRLGDQIRVSARLMNVVDGRSLWSGTFDECFTDVFAVQDAISQKVAQALEVQLSGKEKQRLTRLGTSDIEAYQLYLTGRYHWNKLTPRALRTSIDFFQQATEIDPNYALAFCGMAEAHRALAITSDVPSKETIPQAKAAARRAIQIDDSLAEPRATLVFALIWFDWDWAAAEEEAKRAIDLNPNLAMAHVAYAHLLADLGRHEEAVAAAARARRLDPISLIVNAIEGSLLYFAERDELARARLEKTIELDPNFWIAHLFLGKVFLETGDYAEAIAAFNRAKELSHGNSETISMLGYAWAVTGDSVRARAVLAELKLLAAQRYIPPNSFAAIHLGLGEHDETFAWLEKAYADRDVRLSFLKVDRKWKSLRSDPRFVALLKRVGLE
jgi:TolB-like protein/tetratricopeptide (TPR) repeat protein